MVTRHIAVLAITVVFISISSSPSFAQQSARLSGTQVKLITPFHAGTLGAGLVVTSRGNGTCFAGSAAVSGRPDAWRCSIANAIHDPCFQNVLGDPKLLTCFESPWNTNVTVLTLTSPLPTEERKNIALKESLPWALELASGQHCTLLTGATAPIAGMRINYGCPGGFTAVGDIDRSQAVWRIFFQGEKSRSLDLTDIAVAWY